MGHSNNNKDVEARIRRIERGLHPVRAVWSQDREPISLEAWMAYNHTPGVSIAVINDGQIEWARGYGVHESGQPVSVKPETIFQACSISKHVAMVGALRLVRDGLLNLDEDINRYLVSWKVPTNGTWQPRVTLRHLLGHTAGLTWNWYRGFRRGEATPTLLQVLEGQPPANTPPVRVVLLPGSQFRYSGSHYSVIQQAMIDVTGMPFPQLMHELVLGPLQMNNSSYEQSYPETRPDSTATGHYIGGEQVHGKWRVIPEMAGAGLWTTPTDLARLACEIQRAYTGEPTRVLEKAIVDQALAGSGDTYYGLGTAVEGEGEAQRFGHGGDNIGYKCQSTAYVKHGLGAVVMTNGDDGYTVVQDVLRAIAEEYSWPNYEPKRTKASIDSRSYEAYVGRYEVRLDYSLTIQKQAERLYMEVPGQPPIELEPSSETAFFAQVVNSTITFNKNDAGEITGLTIKQEWQELQANKIQEQP